MLYTPVMKTTTRIKLLALTAAYGLLIIGCASPQRTGQAAPDFTLDSLSGQSVSLSHYKGNVVLLSFWAVGCGPCRAEAPHLKALHEKYGDRGLRVVTVNAWDEPKAQVAKFVEKQNIPYIVLLNGGKLFRENYGGKAIPQVYLLDREGKVAFTHLGWSSGDQKELEQQIEELLKVEPNTPPE